MVVLSISERPASSIPLTGDSQTDSDILAFIKARQSILQKKCKYTFLHSSAHQPLGMEGEGQSKEWAEKEIGSFLPIPETTGLTL